MVVVSAGTYHGDPEVKAKHVALAKHHVAADLLLAGTYGGKAGPACSVGCLARDYGLKTDDHEGLAEAAGLPLWLVRVQDYAFERLPSGAWGGALEQDFTGAYRLTADGVDAIFQSFVETTFGGR